MVRSVVRPTLTAFLPEPCSATRTAVISLSGRQFSLPLVADRGDGRGPRARHPRRRRVRPAVAAGRHGGDRAGIPGQRRGALQGHSREDPRGVTATGSIGALAVEEARPAIRVVRREASRFGVAPERIGILGFSAGGMVAAERRGLARGREPARLHGADLRSPAGRGRGAGGRPRPSSSSPRMTIPWCPQGRA